MAASIPLITADGIKLVKPPNLNNPNMICKMPANATAIKNNSKEPNCEIAAAQIAVSPAAGPLTLKDDLLINVTISPPKIPAINPEYIGAFDANETPKQSGSATKKTLMPALKSCFRNDKK